jgi:hypothetical protein
MDRCTPSVNLDQAPVSTVSSAGTVSILRTLPRHQAGKNSRLSSGLRPEPPGKSVFSIVFDGFSGR